MTTDRARPSGYAQGCQAWPVGLGLFLAQTAVLLPHASVQPWQQLPSAAFASPSAKGRLLSASDAVATLTRILDMAWRCHGLCVLAMHKC